MGNALRCSDSIRRARRSIHRRRCCTSKRSQHRSRKRQRMIVVIRREGITKIIQSHLLESLPSLSMQSIQMDYHRISSNHYSIPPYSSIDSFRFACVFISSLLQTIQSFPDKTDPSCTILLLAHNLGGLLFHLPLFMLFLTHIRAESDLALDSSALFGSSQKNIRS